jgi:DNA repair protein RecN (Recombination protein N)
MFIPKYNFILLYYLTICLALTYYFRIVLKQLSISNYAIIDALEVEFASGMNVITGETGAGKSILLGALSLVLGERADSKVLLDQQKKCVIEAQFSVDNALLPEINGEEFDIDTSIILRREIAITGKSRSFINDTPATLQQLKHVGELLVNMHSQHETLDLIERGFQMNVLDTYAGLREEVKSFRDDFFAYKKEA